jgi:hypothetical protein
MLYQPNFCCHCGDKIERIDWKLWTSRKFCENCEKDFRKEEWSPRIVALSIGLFGIFGLGSYLKTPEKPLNISANQVVMSSSNKVQNLKNESVSTTNINQNLTQNRTTANANLPNNEQNRVSEQITHRSQTATIKSNETANTPTTISEPSYYCGAQTKKGTPCTRKVKGGGRCWQHTGLPAILPKDKLIVSKN